MAYIDADLYKVAELGGGKTLWSYHTVDTEASVNSAAYFTGEALKKLAIGDGILVHVYTTTKYTGAIAAVSYNVVSANNGTTADVNDGVSLMGSDTD